MKRVIRVAAAAATSQKAAAKAAAAAAVKPAAAAAEGGNLLLALSVVNSGGGQVEAYVGRLKCPATAPPPPPNKPPDPLPGPSPHCEADYLEYLLLPPSTFPQHGGTSDSTTQKGAIPLASPLYNSPDLPPPRNSSPPSRTSPGLAERVGESNKLQTSESTEFMVVPIRHLVFGWNSHLVQTQYQ